MAACLAFAGDILFLAVLVLGPSVVYLDATGHGVGKIKEEKSGFLKNWRAADWAICCTCFGPLGLAAYWWKRKALLAFAKDHPVRVPVWQRTAVILLLLMIAMVGVIQIGPPEF
jgi:hypothetical protein